jgi:hypothetical protein
MHHHQKVGGERAGKVQVEEGDAGEQVSRIS